MPTRRASAAIVIRGVGGQLTQQPPVNRIKQHGRISQGHGSPFSSIRRIIGA
jgi:hypothetical protein